MYYNYPYVLYISQGVVLLSSCFCGVYEKEHVAFDVRDDGNGARNFKRTAVVKRSLCFGYGYMRPIVKEKNNDDDDVDLIVRGFLNVYNCDDGGATNCPHYGRGYDGNIWRYAGAVLDHDVFSTATLALSHIL